MTTPRGAPRGNTWVGEEAEAGRHRWARAWLVDIHPKGSVRQVGKWASFHNSRELWLPRVSGAVWPWALGWSQQVHGGGLKHEKQIKEVLRVQDPPACLKSSP